MKIYPDGPRKLNEILKKFRAKGFSIDRTKYDEEFSDWMTAFDPSGFRRIIFNTCNNRFIVSDLLTHEIIGTESSEELEAEGWYMEILGILFKGEPVEEAGR